MITITIKNDMIESIDNPNCENITIIDLDLNLEYMIKD